MFYVYSAIDIFIIVTVIVTVIFIEFDTVTVIVT